METQVVVSKSPHPLIWVAAIALIIFCGVVAAALMGWMPTTFGQPAPEAPLVQAPAPVAVPAGESREARLAREARQAREAREVREARERREDRADARADARNRAYVPPVAAVCTDCGVIQLVREIETKGEGSGVGAVGGAIAGGLLGSQVGDGSGKKIATVVGAVGGVLAGNEIEKRVRSTKSYEITVRFDNGTSQVIPSATAPSWRAGDKVRVINGVIHSNAA